ncbi:hypothetical protein JAAARDRAFT_68531 [Jaapia argillacea MUCL 33604]|uniref:Uncharacterized protein n=1 Tax=Jaapia argillacea MUCL 33604 TaxID=933084 RepID=A0A067PYK6_9AGAM|nr:hypothetical protein JAAARDRAFT_68531 [Jaapia argillacea MUCL 33604]
MPRAVKKKQRLSTIKKRVSFNLALQDDLIPKPTQCAFDYSAPRLMIALGFENVQNARRKYRKLKKEVMALAARYLTMGKPWTLQDPAKFKIFKEAALQRYPVFQGFENDWSIEYLVKLELRNDVQRQKKAQSDKEIEEDDEDEGGRNDESEGYVKSPPPRKPFVPRNERPRRAVATLSTTSSSPPAPAPSTQASSSSFRSRPPTSINGIRTVNKSGSISFSQSPSQSSFPSNPPGQITTAVEEFLYSIRAESTYPFFEDAGIKTEEDLEIFLSWEIERQEGLFDRVVDGKKMSWLQVNQIRNGLGHGLKK